LGVISWGDAIAGNSNKSKYGKNKVTFSIYVLQLYDAAILFIRTDESNIETSAVLRQLMQEEWVKVVQQLLTL
jgi:hypothetical protein